MVRRRVNRSSLPCFSCLLEAAQALADPQSVIETHRGHSAMRKQAEQLLRLRLQPRLELKRQLAAISDALNHKLLTCEGSLPTTHAADQAFLEAVFAIAAPEFTFEVWAQKLLRHKQLIINPITCFSQRCCWRHYAALKQAEGRRERDAAAFNLAQRRYEQTEKGKAALQRYRLKPPVQKRRRSLRHLEQRPRGTHLVLVVFETAVQGAQQVRQAIKESDILAADFIVRRATDGNGLLLYWRGAPAPVSVIEQLQALESLRAAKMQICS